MLLHVLYLFYELGLGPHVVRFGFLADAPHLVGVNVLTVSLVRGLLVLLNRPLVSVVLLYQVLLQTLHFLSHTRDRIESLDQDLC